MTTCAECLTTLATARMTDITRGSPVVEHCASCERCAEVATEMRLAEHRLALTLAQLKSNTPPEILVSGAIEGAERLRRRTAARWFRAAAAVVLLFLAGTFVKENLIDARSMDGLIVDTIMLKCMTPDDAISLVTPYLRADRSAAYRAGSAAITLRGTPQDVAAAIARVDAYEQTTCPLPTGPAAPTGQR